MGREVVSQLSTAQGNVYPSMQLGNGHVHPPDQGSPPPEPEVAIKACGTHPTGVSVFLLISKTRYESK